MINVNDNMITVILMMKIMIKNKRINKNSNTTINVCSNKSNDNRNYKNNHNSHNYNNINNNNQ